MGQVRLRGVHRAEVDHLDLAERERLRAGWRASGVYADVTVAEVFANGAEHHGADEVVFASSDGAAEVCTLRSLHEAARATASRMSAAGVSAGDVVVVQGPADRAGTEVLEALWMLGAVVVPVPTTFDGHELAHVLVDSGASTFVAPVEWRGEGLVARALELAPGIGLDRIFALGDEAPAGARPLDSLPDGGGHPAPRPSPATVCCILYTSGSTAAPKGVQHSHETLLAGITAAPPDSSTRMLATFPAGHVASLLGLVRPLAVGGSTVIMDRWSARTAAALIEEHGLTTSVGTPFFLSTLLDEADRSARRHLVVAALPGRCRHRAACARRPRVRARHRHLAHVRVDGAPRDQHRSAG